MSNNKFLTEEVIKERMESKGWIEGCDDEHARNQVLAHYDCEITDNWNRGLSFYVYEESTADGYSVWVTTNNPDRIDYGSELWYYDGGIQDQLAEAIREGGTIYIDCDDYVDSAVEDLYLELLERMEEEIIDELVDEGYIELIEHPVNALQWIEMVSQDDQFTKGVSEIYDGCVKVETGEGYPWRKFALEVRTDPARYKVVLEHYGLKITKSSAGAMTFELINTEE